MIGDIRRALVLAPHTDDGEFGCGGTMARLVEAGADVRYVAFSIATRSLPRGVRARHAGARGARGDGRARHPGGEPDRARLRRPHVPRPPAGDPRAADRDLERLAARLRLPAVAARRAPGSPDDRAAKGSARSSARRSSATRSPGTTSTSATRRTSRSRSAHIERKVAALAKYASQQHRRYANAEYVWNVARTHGINVNREYAEVFQVYRVVA